MTQLRKHNHLLLEADELTGLASVYAITPIVANVSHEQALNIVRMSMAGNLASPGLVQPIQQQPFVQMAGAAGAAGGAGITDALSAWNYAQDAAAGAAGAAGGGRAIRFGNIAATTALKDGVRDLRIAGVLLRKSTPESRRSGVDRRHLFRPAEAKEIVAKAFRGAQLKARRKTRAPDNVTGSGALAAFEKVLEDNIWIQLRPRGKFADGKVAPVKGGGGAAQLPLYENGVFTGITLLLADPRSSRVVKKQGYEPVAEVVKLAVPVPNIAGRVG